MTSHRAPALGRVHLLFFASGVAGLVYEVSWVRQIGNVFGNTSTSASLVTAVFMCGLGVGSYWAGVHADRAPRPTHLLRAYAIAELLIGACGLALLVVLPRLGAISASLSSYARGADGWYAASTGTQVLRCLVAAMLVGPPSLLMGATLTLLVRAIMMRADEAGHRIGVLYGVNTAGAALGAIACDAFLVPRFGIAGTQELAVTLNFVVAVVAWRSALPVAEARPAPPPDAAPRATDRARRATMLASVALALSGFASLGMELVWFRFLSAILGGYRFVFSIVLATILVGIWIGATAAALLVRPRADVAPRPARLFLLAQGLLVATAFAMLASASPSVETTYGNALGAVVRVVLVPSIAMGASFPLVNAWLHDTMGSVGRRTGVLYLANTLGSVAGSLVAGFVLAPRIGSVASFGVFAVVAALAPLALLREERKVGLVAVAIAVPVFGAWFSLPDRFIASRYLPLLRGGHPVLAAKEGPNEMVMIIERSEGHRVLVTNGHPMSGTSLAGQRYMRAFAHVPLLMTAEPKRALVVCFGVGSTLHATSLHPLERIELVDLSRNVLEHAPWFAENHHDVLHDPRVAVYVEDGRQHLRQAAPDTFDLVTMEPPPIGFAGIASLYSVELYTLARTRLRPGGMMTQWLPAYDVPPDVGLAMVKAFLEVFPGAVLLSGWGPELILLGKKGDGLAFDLDAVEASLRARPRVLADLERVRMGNLRELVGTFVADASALARATAPVTAITDDDPRMEYTFGEPASLASALFEGPGTTIRGVGSFCPRCFVGTAIDPRVDGLVEHLTILDRVYRDPRFRKNELPYKTRATTPREASLAKVSPYLAEFVAPPEKDKVEDPRAHFVRGFELAQRGQLEAAVQAFERGLALAPDDIDAHYNHAVVLASLGRSEDALREAKRTLALAPNHPKAGAMVCALAPAECAAPATSR